MTLIINPGSGPVHIDGPGWTNTYGTALVNARRWLDTMKERGFRDVVMLPTSAAPTDGRWTFTFRHNLTRAEVTLEIDGIDNMAAFEKQHIFGTRTYWNGSSCSEPSLDDFAAEGFEKVVTFRHEGARN